MLISFPTVNMGSSLDNNNTRTSRKTYVVNERMQMSYGDAVRGEGEGISNNDDNDDGDDDNVETCQLLSKA